MPRALVYRPGSLGDTLVSLPAVAEIRRRYPDHQLTLLTESQATGSGRVSPWTILKETGWFDDVHFYVVKPSSARERWHNLALAARLRATGYHDIFSLAPPRTTRQLRVDSRIFRGVVGATRYHAAQSAAWPPSAVDPATIEHEGLRLLRIVDPAASGDALGDFRLAVPDTERALGNGLLESLGVRPDQLLVGVGPGSGRSSTRWPAERFAAVGNALLQQFRNVVLLAIGGISERTLCDELCAAWGPRSHNLAGPVERVWLGLGPVAVRHLHRQRLGSNASRGDDGHALRGDLQRAQRARPVGAARPASRVLEERPECAGCMLDECVHEAKKCLTRIQIGRVVREAVSLIESRGTACLAV